MKDAMIDRDNLMTPFQKALWSFLRERFAGVENASPRATIESRFFLLHESMRTDDRTFREAISELVTVYRKPICTSPAKGYFVAKTEREKQEALNYLDSVISEVAGRRRALAETDPLERQERLF